MKKILGWFGFILLVIAAFLIWWYYFKTYSEGSRTGLLQKFSHKGNIFLTYEGELVLSSIQSTTGAGIASEKFYFSVPEKRIADSLQKYEGNYVKVFYSQKRRTLPWRGDTPYLVDSVIFIRTLLPGAGQ